MSKPNRLPRPRPGNRPASKYEYVEEFDRVFRCLPEIRDALERAGVDSYSFTDAGREWVVADHRGTVTIREGYASDGCSCAPDFKRVKKACLLHDGLRQALGDENCPWTREETDLAFLRAMERRQFKLASVYYYAVAGPLGDLYRRWKK